MLKWAFRLFFLGFSALGRDGKSLVVLEVFLGKTKQPRKGRRGFQGPKTPISPGPWKRELSVKKIPVFLQGNTGEMLGVK